MLKMDQAIETASVEQKLVVCVVCCRNFECNQIKPSPENCKSIFKACLKFLKSDVFNTNSSKYAFHHGPLCSDCLNHGEKLSELHKRLKEIKTEIQKYEQYFTTELLKYRVDTEDLQPMDVCKTEMSYENELGNALIKKEADWDVNYDHGGSSSDFNGNDDSDELFDDNNDSNGIGNDDEPGNSKRSSPVVTNEDKSCSTIDSGEESDILVSENESNKNEPNKKLIKGSNKLPWKCDVCAKVCLTSRQRKDHMRTVHYKNYLKLLTGEQSHVETETQPFYQELLENKPRKQRAAAIKAKSKLMDLAKEFLPLPSENIKDESGSEEYLNNDDDEDLCLTPTDAENILKNREHIKKPKCPVCRKIFANSAALKTHLHTHTSWECGKCDKIFYSRRSQMNHLRRTHRKMKDRKNGDSFVCEVGKCQESFPNEYELEVHCMTHTDEIPFECQLCHCKYSNLKNYLNHQRDSPCTNSGIPGAPEEFNCDLCKKTFKVKYLLLIHRKQHNAKHKNYKCELCVRSFARRPDFIKHVMVHTDETPFSCDICGKRFRSSSGVGPHRLSHTGREIFSCKYCDVKCSSTHALKRHVQSKHQEKIYTCDVCEKQYKIYGDFKVHVRSHSKNIPCEECGKTFYRHADLNRHRRRHTGNLFQCPNCPKGFLNLSCLKKHTEEIHMGKKYICEICGKVLSTSLSIAVHIKSHKLKEKGERPFPCTNCQKKFYTKRELVEHNRTHTGERLPCHICGEQFTRKLLLDYHMKSHTGNYKYQCEICGKGLATKTMATIHSRTHTGEKPFVCPCCGKAFSRKDHMKEHVRRHEKIGGTSC